MRSLPIPAVLALASFLSLACHAQSAPAPVPSQAPAQTPNRASVQPGAPNAALPSATLNPALQKVQDTLGSLQLQKWKKGTVRDEATDHVNAILHDMQSNLPPLVQDADSAPGALSKGIPLMKHMDALYDVLLRVEEASRVSAPPEQVDQLQQVLKSLGDARFALDDQYQLQAAAQEKQISDLRVALQARPPAPTANTSATDTKPCTPPAPAHKKKRAAPAKKPQTTTPAPAPQKTPPGI